jgi:L-methionine (R)-S-oxide reductase
MSKKHGGNDPVSLEEFEAALEGRPASRKARLEVLLGLVANYFEAATVTIHRALPDEESLELVGSLNLPEKLIPVTSYIPYGKGMAGLCAARREPVTVCNLQTDSSGCARPAARETGVAGALVVPIFGKGRKLRGTLGIGKLGEHTYTQKEIESLSRFARLLVKALDWRFADGE